jgi:DnaK suppressor protein
MIATPHKPSRIEYFRDLLTTKQSDLEAHKNIADVAAKPVTLDQQSVGRVSRIDAIQQQQMALANRQQASALRQQIESALRRIDDGSYGDCLHCGEVISDARLQAQPWASRCIDCQSALESS